MNFEPRESASFSISTMRFTTVAGQTTLSDDGTRAVSLLEQRLEAELRHGFHLGRGVAEWLGAVRRVARQELARTALGVELAVLDDGAAAGPPRGRAAPD